VRLKAGTILAVDRGYNDYVWFRQLTRDGVFFVTRMKTNTVYTTIEVRAVPEKGNVLSDQIISVPSLGKHDEAPVLFRRIEYWNADKQEILVFFTNLLHLAASTVAAIYKDRWQIELFFKALKQTAKVKSFLGTSANAVKTQIWTALIAMLILKYLQMKSSFGWSLSNQQLGGAVGRLSVHDRIVGPIRSSILGSGSRRVIIRSAWFPLFNEDVARDSNLQIKAHMTFS
jgi:hypothetical protein